MNILIVEDSASDAIIAEESLSSDPTFRCSTVSRLCEALSQLKEKTYDVVLLDLGLPDSQGLDTLHALHPHCGPGTAIVVLTGNNDRTQGSLALRSGAQDYLFKNHLDNPEALRRCLIGAYERRWQSNKISSLERELELARKEECRNTETAFWTQLSHNALLDVAHQSKVGHGTLRDGAPETFSSFVTEYGKVLEAALEARNRKANNDIATLNARLAWRLGEHHASPRDVIEIHIMTLRSKMGDALSLVRAMTYQEEGRLRIVELMGFLASYYRLHIPPKTPE